MNREVEPRMACYCFYLFGPPRLERNSKTIQIQRRKGLALLAYLAVTNREHSREFLATMLWAELDQSAALANLRRELSELKRQLGEDLLLVDRQTIRINPASDLWLDVNEFIRRIEMAVEGSVKSPKSPNPESFAARQEAAALYSEDFMQGFNLPDSQKFDEWQFFQAEELRQRMIENLQVLIQDLVEKKAYIPALDFARRWLSMDLLQEPAHRMLMTLYGLSGQKAAALRQFQECERILWEELGVLPEEETTQLYETLRSGQVGQAQKEAVTPTNLPAQTTAFIGRKKELRELQHFIGEETENRLITILGPGGIGKTRFAIEAARSTVVRFKHGVYFFSLAAIRSRFHMISAMADSFGIHHQHREDDDQEQQVLDYLRDRQLLLVMDNFEHLIESANFLSAIIEIAPGVKILVTSRERLGLTSETMYSLAGMDYPENDDTVHALEFDAVSLLLQNIQRQKSGYKPDHTDLLSMVRICRLVQGTPLALVLAAGWVNALSICEIADEIAHSLDILETEMQDLPKRQQSMRAVFDYSWNLLGTEQQQAVMKCSVFSEGFSRQAAYSVSGASIQTLLSMIHKSWLQRDEDGRYHFHELVRQYAQAKLEMDPEEYAHVRAAHAAFFAALLEEIDTRMKGPQQKQAFLDVAVEFENIRSAWFWFLQANQLETAIQSILPGLFRYCEARARSLDLLQLIGGALDSIAENRSTISRYHHACLLTARAAFFRNGLPVRFGIFGMLIPVEERVLLKAWSYAGSLDELQAMGFWGILLAYLYGRILNFDAGTQMLQELVERFRNPEYTAQIKQDEWQDSRLWNFAFCEELFLMLILDVKVTFGTDVNALEKMAEEAVKIFQELGDERETGLTLRLFGQLRKLQHDFPAALQQWQMAQERLAAAGEWSTAADLHWYIGDIHLQFGEFEQAFQHYQAMIQVYMEKGAKMGTANMLSKESYEALRYSDVNHALKTRQQSLVLAREMGDIFTEGWFLWEMGEIYRVMGEPAQARKFYQEAKTLLDRTEDSNGGIYYHRGLGDLALESGNFAEAQQQFEKSLQFARNTEHTWGLAYAFTGLGRAAAGLGLVDRARKHFLQALVQARKADELGITMTVVAGIAEYFAARGDEVRALQLADLVMGHPLSWRETKARIRAFREIVSGVPTDSPTLHKVSGTGSMDVWGEIYRLMEELGD